MKTCRRCETPKPPEDFGVDSRNPSGRAGTCRLCINELARAHSRRKHARVEGGNEPRDAFGTLHRTLLALEAERCSAAELSAYFGIERDAVYRLLRGQEAGAFRHRMTRAELHHLTGGRCGR